MPEETATQPTTNTTTQPELTLEEREDAETSIFEDMMTGKFDGPVTPTAPQTSGGTSSA